MDTPKKGKFIVIDGTDGSGKGTQTTLLVQRLQSEWHDVKMADFPRYGERSAMLVEDYLNGKFGTAQDVWAHRASVFFACDRYAASFEIRQWIDEGK
jgi:dTMP kinase